MRRKPWVAGSSPVSKNRSSLNAPSSQTRLPSSPLSSTRRPSSWPVAKRVASKLPRAPPAKRAMNTAASSTVTGPRAPMPSASGRSRTNVSVSPETPAIRSPARYWARSTAWAPRSPSAPDPACSAWSRHIIGISGVEEMAAQVGAPDVADGAEPAGRDQLPGQGDGRDPAEVEAGHRPDAAGGRPGRGGGHGPRLLDGVGQWLLAEDVLAGLQGGDRDLGVAGARGADVDQVDVVALDQPLPVGLPGGPAEPAGRGRHGGGVPAADGGHPGREREVEDVADRPPGLGVGAAHERVADHPDPEHAVTGRHVAPTPLPPG